MASSLAQSVCQGNTGAKNKQKHINKGGMSVQINTRGNQRTDSGPALNRQRPWHPVRAQGQPWGPQEGQSLALSGVLPPRWETKDQPWTWDTGQDRVSVAPHHRQRAEWLAQGHLSPLGKGYSNGTQRVLDRHLPKEGREGSMEGRREGAKDEGMDVWREGWMRRLLLTLAS